MAEKKKDIEPKSPEQEIETVVNLDSEEHKIDKDTKTKISLISILVIIFVLSLSLIAWVIWKEQSSSEEVVVEKYPTKARELFVPETEEQKELLEVQEDLAQMEEDLDDLNKVLNDEDADKYGEALD